MSSITDGIKLSLRKATAILLSVSLDSVSEPTFSSQLLRHFSFEQRRRLVNKLIVSFIVSIPSESAASAQKTTESAFQMPGSGSGSSSGSKYIQLVTQIAANDGVAIPTIQYLGSTVTTVATPTTQPTLSIKSETTIPRVDLILILVFSSLGGSVIVLFVYALYKQRVTYLQIKDNFDKYEKTLDDIIITSMSTDNPKS